MDDTWLYFAARDTTTWTQTLYRVAKTGGDPQALLTHGEGMSQAVNSDLEQSVVLHDGWIHWSSYASPPGVFRVLADGSGQAETLLRRARAGALAIEGDDLFVVIRRGFEDGREIAGEEGGLLRTGLSGRSPSSSAIRAARTTWSSTEGTSISPRGGRSWCSRATDGPCRSPAPLRCRTPGSRG